MIYDCNEFILIIDIFLRRQHSLITRRLINTLEAVIKQEFMRRFAQIIVSLIKF